MYKGLKPAGKHLALLWQCCCLPVYTRFQARGKAFGIVCCPCLPVYTWFQARGKAFGIVVTTLLSSRLHLIPSPAGKHYELYSVLILFPLFSSSFFSLHFFFPPFPFWFPASFSVSRGHQVPRFHIFSTPEYTALKMTGHMPWKNRVQRVWFVAHVDIQPDEKVKTKNPLQAYFSSLRRSDSKCFSPRCTDTCMFTQRQVRLFNIHTVYNLPHTLLDTLSEDWRCFPVSVS